LAERGDSRRLVGAPRGEQSRLTHQPEMSVCDPKATFHLLTIAFGALAVALGENDSVTHVFQPEARFSAANSQ